MLTITENDSLKPLNTMGIDGSAAAVARWDNAADLHNLFTDPAYVPLTTGQCKAIGEGSNLLFTSCRYDGLLLKCTDDTIETIDCDDDSVSLRVHAGRSLDSLVETTCGQGLWGAENLSMIPGTTGGATVQNVGAYGTEFGDLVTAIHCYDRDEDRVVVFSHDDASYGYRDSAFKHAPVAGRMIVVATEIRLARNPRPRLDYGNLRKALAHLNDRITPDDVRREIIGIRRSKLPGVGETGSAGSFFKNPVVTPATHRHIIDTAVSLGIDTSTMPAHETTDSEGNPAIKLSAAWLIDQSGWKGYRRCNVGTWPSQPLVLVNITGNATGQEITALAADITADVESKWHVTLTPEVEYL